MGLDPIPLAYVFDASPSPCVYGIMMCPLVSLSLVVSLPSGLPPIFPLWLFPSLLSSWLLLINLLSILYKAHVGYLHLVWASLGCFISWLRSSVECKQS